MKTDGRDSLVVPALEVSPIAKNARVGLIAGIVAVTTVLHHITPVDIFALHNLYQRLYYIPIFLAAYWFGFRAAIVTSVVSAASYLPHILFDWHVLTGLHDEYLQAQYVELVMFQVVAVVVGALAESGHRLTAQQERTAEELAEAYRSLQESFDQLRRADRMTALGELSAGLAHEIRNPLASIKASLEILVPEFPPGHKKREFVEIAKKQIGQLDRIVGEFLNFARTPRPVREPCDIRDVASSLKILCSKEASRQGVEIAIDASDRVPELELDASQVQQALLNVVLNGVQAMPAGGRLEISTRDSGDCVLIRVRDEGPGIAAEDRDNIFEPFFTTKARGTGLGLALARKLIEAQGGRMRLEENPPNTGSSFLIELPYEIEGDDGQNSDSRR
ncbi:MAG: ATP-binding protein [Acidobacteriota bacterium]|nr:MAG: ATP-binding protein [Acidobacteriota bacterium]